MNTFQVGQRVIVLSHLETYDSFAYWEHIARVPNFQIGAIPDNGKEYQITFIEYMDETRRRPYRMVLDNTFIVNEKAFEEPPYHPAWDEYMFCA